MAVNQYDLPDFGKAVTSNLYSSFFLVVAGAVRSSLWRIFHILLYYTTLTFAPTHH